MTGRDRRALWVGGGVVVAAVFLLRILPWGMRHALGARASLHERATLLVHAQQDLADAALLRDSAARITRALVGLAPKLLSGTSAAEAGADLVAQLNLVASRSNARVEQVDLVPDTARAGRLSRARVRVALETDIRGLLHALHAIAAGSAALEVFELRVSAPDPGSPERLPEVLKVEMTIGGWFLEVVKPPERSP